MTASGTHGRAIAARRLRLLIALAAAPGCSAPAETDDTSLDHAQRTIASLAAPEALNAACEACHTAEASQWRGSLHRDAFSNEAFQRSFAREPKPFCQGCHAPHADPNQAPPAWAAANGVTCLSCHIEGEAVRATMTARSTTPSPHPLVRSREFSRAQACAGCHEFDFPTSRRHAAGHRMQLTLTEHARSGSAELGCADCHMPAMIDDAGRHRDHRFDVSRNPSLLRAALTASAQRLGPDKLRLYLAPVAVGHALPTGDLFRRLELRVEAHDGGGERRAGATRYLARHFPARPRTGPASRRPDPLEPDDRLTTATTFEMVAPGAQAEHTLTWRISYQRVDHRDVHAPERSTLAGEVILAEGELSAYEPTAYEPTAVAPGSPDGVEAVARGHTQDEG